MSAKTQTRGTCQICARSVAVKTGNMKADGTPVYFASLHGYNRPGWGSIVGRCWGAAHEPYETGHTRLDQYIAWVEAQLKSAEERLADLQEGRVTTIQKSVRTYHRGMGKDEPVEFRADMSKEEWPKAGITYGWYTWERLLEATVREQNGTIKMINQELDYLRERRAAWKSEPEALQTK